MGVQLPPAQLGLDLVDSGREDAGGALLLGEGVPAHWASPPPRPGYAWRGGFLAREQLYPEFLPCCGLNPVRLQS